MKWLPSLAALAALAACGQSRGDRELSNETAEAESPKAPTPDVGPAAESGPDDARNPPPPLIGEEVAVAEWRKADNRESCAPLALVSDGDAPATPRRANFSGGWAVAFDRPGLRSAYGFAGTGLLPEDQADFAVKVDRLAQQWPYVRRWNAGEYLPAGTAAGYGLEGARPYGAGNPSGRGEHGIAYLRIPGQPCQYNVWSRLSRDHLETLLRSLRIVEP